MPSPSKFALGEEKRVVKIPFPSPARSEFVRRVRVSGKAIKPLNSARGRLVGEEEDEEGNLFWSQFFLSFLERVKSGHKNPV